ncbi:hypothetical protein D3C76_1828170 [compost metagenome]
MEPVQVEGNSRDKYIVLTAAGTEVCRRMLEIKQSIEQRIEGKIGADKVKLLKQLLAEDWL